MDFKDEIKQYLLEFGLNNTKDAFIEAIIGMIDPDMELEDDEIVDNLTVYVAAYLEVMEENE